MSKNNNKINRMAEAKKEEQWEKKLVNVQGITEAVATTAWNTDIQGRPEHEIYDIYIDKDGNQVKEVNEVEAMKFWNMYTSYGALIESYVKDIPEE